VGKRYCEAGYEVVSLDNDPRWGPTILVDVLEWDYRAAYPPGYFQRNFCSPQCSEYSRAKTTRPRNLDMADTLVRRALEIVEYLRPEVWWLENPRWGLLSKRFLMEGIPVVDVGYCQYSTWGYMKPTRIWGSPQVTSLQLKICDMQTCSNLIPGVAKHKVVLSSPHQNIPRKLKYRIPPALVDHIIWSVCQERFSRRVKLPIRLMKNPETLEEGKISRVGPHKQLLLRVKAECPMG